MEVASIQISLIENNKSATIDKAAYPLTEKIQVIPLADVV